MNKHFKKYILLMSSVFIMATFSYANAATAIVSGHIQRTLVDVHYGGCMVILSQDVQSVLPSCGSLWVSLDCDGIYHTQAQANAMWSSALVGLSLQNKVHAFVDDTKKVNGYCVAMRLDMEH